MNKYQPHVWVIPEDDANRQLANGFIDHHGVNDLRIQTMPSAGGWSKVLQQFLDEYVHVLQNNQNAHVVMLIDFDGKFEGRIAEFNEAIPANLKDRVFVIGSKTTPELLRKELKTSFESIGESLAEDCHTGSVTTWTHEHLNHNETERQRLVQIVKRFLF